MRRKIIVVAALFASLAVPAQAAAPTPAPAFVSDKSHEYFGYYETGAQPQIVIGKWALEMIAIGPRADFGYFEAGKEDPDLPGRPVRPFLIEFIEAHPAAGQTATEIIVSPDSFRFQGDKVSFAGHEGRLGKVTFVGTFTAAFMKAAATKDGPHEGDAVVLTGTLTVGAVQLPLRLHWTGGGD